MRCVVFTGSFVYLPVSNIDLCVCFYDFQERFTRIVRLWRLMRSGKCTADPWNDTRAYWELQIIRGETPQYMWPGMAKWGVVLQKSRSSKNAENQSMVLMHIRIELLSFPHFGILASNWNKFDTTRKVILRRNWKIGKENLTGLGLESETSGFPYQCSSIWAIQPLDDGPPKL